MKKLIVFFGGVLCFFLNSCEKSPLEPQGPILSMGDSLEVSVSAGGLVIGASASDVTEISVTFAGEVASDSLHTAVSYGLMYVSADKDSLTVNNSKKVELKKLDEENRFAQTVEKLAPGTGYMWTVFVEADGEFVLGSVRTFTTLDLIAPVVGEVTDISHDEATFEGEVTVPSAASKSLAYGVLYSDDKKALKEFEGDIHEFDEDEISKKGKFSSVLRGIKPETKYYYMPYITMNKVTVYGEMDYFETGSAPVPGSGVEGTDLSDALRATANCYIVNRGGTYKFPAVIGNGKEYVSGGASAQVLWESFGTDEMPEEGALISSVSFKNNFVSFSVPEDFKKGNAVIAVKNAAGVVLWSWHIWLTDQPAECVLANDAGILMDRNLGATSAAADRVESNGLLYQWGRKDPFMGAAQYGGYNASSQVASAASTIDWPEPYEIWGEQFSVSYATENPATFVLYNESGTIEELWLPDVKTIYDPCPSGWRIPAAHAENPSEFFAVSAGFIGHDGSVFGVSGTQFGVQISSAYSPQLLWFPMAGQSDLGNSSDVILAGAGFVGEYWLAECANWVWPMPYRYTISGGAFSLPMEASWGVDLGSVRCIKE